MSDRVPISRPKRPAARFHATVRAVPRTLAPAPTAPRRPAPAPEPVPAVEPDPLVPPSPPRADSAPWREGADGQRGAPTASPSQPQPRSDSHASHQTGSCTHEVFTDYAHTASVRVFRPWSPDQRDYPAFLGAIEAVNRSVRSPFLSRILERSGDFAVHFNVESGLNNGSPTRPMVGDEGVRTVQGRSVRTSSYGIAQLHSPGLLRTYQNRQLLGDLAGRVPPPSSAMVANPAGADWSPVVCTPAGLLYAVIRLREYERMLNAHFDRAALARGEYLPTTDAGRALAAAAKALCTPVPLEVVIMRGYMASSSIQGMTNYFTGRTKRTVSVRVSRRPTPADLSSDPQLMALRDPQGPLRLTPTVRDPWWWRSQGSLRISWEMRR